MDDEYVAPEGAEDNNQTEEVPEEPEAPKFSLKAQMVFQTLMVEPIHTFDDFLARFQTTPQEMQGDFAAELTDLAAVVGCELKQLVNPGNQQTYICLISAMDNRPFNKFSKEQRIYFKHILSVLAQELSMGWDDCIEERKRIPKLKLSIHDADHLLEVLCNQSWFEYEEINGGRFVSLGVRSMAELDTMLEEELEFPTCTLCFEFLTKDPIRCQRCVDVKLHTCHGLETCPQCQGKTLARQSLLKKYDKKNDDDDHLSGDEEEFQSDADEEELQEQQQQQEQPMNNENPEVEMGNEDDEEYVQQADDDDDLL
eukprot:TRINITY_DN779821_c0_g1_i1.p1 TRINITY_DN779821_c0_g1~~TRINITY_DN779821_c0_g1_i1.p1  ORF type:complete len:322 (+),score=98.67 TRINITY_DN779821_c0_g1_i1:31-966(+)